MTTPTLSDATPPVPAPPRAAAGPRPGALPDHGTISRHKHHRCHCEQCTAAWRDYNATVRRQQAYGRWQPLTDAAPARAHAQQLQAAGVGIRRIATLADLSESVITALLYAKGGRPPRARIRVETAQAILAIPLAAGSLADGALIDATGTRRRLQALIAVGWTRNAVARHLGAMPTHVGQWMRQPTITARCARRVAGAYEVLWDADPLLHGVTVLGSARARARAARLGWAPPLAWDDDLIDDPAARPNLGEQPDRYTAIAEDARWLIAGQGYDRPGAAQRLGITVRHLERALAAAPQPEPTPLGKVTAR